MSLLLISVKCPSTNAVRARACVLVWVFVFGVRCSPPTPLPALNNGTVLAQAAPPMPHFSEGLIYFWSESIATRTETTTSCVPERSTWTKTRTSAKLDPYYKMTMYKGKRRNHRCKLPHIRARAPSFWRRETREGSFLGCADVARRKLQILRRESCHFRTYPCPLKTGGRPLKLR